MPRQIGWSQESNLLYNISMQLDRLAAVTAASGGGGGGGTITGGGANGQVTFWNAATNITGSNNLFWDNAQGRLGIGTNTPSNDLSIVKTVDGTVRMLISNPSTGTSAISDILILSNVGGLSLQVFGSNHSTLSANQARFRSSSSLVNGLTFLTGTTAPLTFGTNDTVGMTMFGITRNVVLQNGGTFLDGGQRLQVNGTSLFTDILNITGTDNLNTLHFITRNLGGVTQFQISNNGDAFSRSSLTTPTLNSNTLRAQQNQNILLEANWASSNVITLQTYFNATNVLLANHSANVVRTSGGNIVIQGTETFAPTSGNATTILALLNPTINQAGGANGITRGLYVQPTLTAAADWRSIEWSNNTGWGLYGQGTADNFLGGGLLINGVLRETITTNRQTASYTLALADRGKLVETNVGAANTLTVPPNSSITFPIGTKIDIAQYGAGQTSIVPGAGVTVRSALGALKLAAQYSGASLVKIGTDEWYLFGDITV